MSSDGSKSGSAAGAHEQVATVDGLNVVVDADAYLQILATAGHETARLLQGRLDLQVPNCPGWTGLDLAVHLGGVYRWVAAIVTSRLAQPPQPQLRAALFSDPDPSDHAAVLDRLRAANELVVEALAAAPDDLDCWTIWPAGPARQFWVRRMVHETSVHLADAMNTGADERDLLARASVETTVAADGIDEKILGFAQRYADNLRLPAATTLAWVARDAQPEDRWWVRLSPDAPVFGRGACPRRADVTVHADAAELLLLVWGRRGPDRLTVAGDATLLDMWRGLAHL